MCVCDSLSLTTCGLPTTAALPGSRATGSLESPGSSELNDEEDTPEPADVDFLDDYDSEEEKKHRKRRKVVSRPRAALPSNSNSRSNKISDSEKPFLCSG